MSYSFAAFNALNTISYFSRTNRRSFDILGIASRLKSDGAVVNAGRQGLKIPFDTPRVGRRRKASSGAMVASPPEKRSEGSMASPSPRVSRNKSFNSTGSGGEEQQVAN